MNILKTIAHPNELTKDIKDDYYLLVKPIGTLHTEDIIARLENKQIATKNVNGAAFLQIFQEECLSAIKEGYSVQTYLCRMYVGVNGTITAGDLGHNIPADRVDVRMYLTQSVDVRKALKQVALHAEEQPAATGPVIQEVFNPVNKKNNTLNIGAMALMQGLRLTVRGDAGDELGVFFTSVEGDITVRVPPEQITPNTPSKLQFILPAGVTAGQWKVSLSTQGSGNGTYVTKNVRCVEYPNTITVI
ncbi:MAG: DUF4469 domain-containing protein [Prevotellaceae bacterium]|jgi:hypothetical protein|nr:DUF4469 domain-containing protein [Prevotellaceae bacterium]